MKTDTESDKMAAEHICKLLGMTKQKDGKWRHPHFVQDLDIRTSTPENIVPDLYSVFSKWKMDDIRDRILEPWGLS